MNQFNNMKNLLLFWVIFLSFSDTFAQIDPVFPDKYVNFELKRYYIPWNDPDNPPSGHLTNDAQTLFDFNDVNGMIFNFGPPDPLLPCDKRDYSFQAYAIDYSNTDVFDSFYDVSILETSDTSHLVYLKSFDADEFPQIHHTFWRFTETDNGPTSELIADITGYWSQNSFTPFGSNNAASFVGMNHDNIPMFRMYDNIYFIGLNGVLQGKMFNDFVDVEGLCGSTLLTGYENNIGFQVWKLDTADYLIHCANRFTRIGNPNLMENQIIYQVDIDSPYWIHGYAFSSLEVHQITLISDAVYVFNYNSGEYSLQLTSEDLGFTPREVYQGMDDPVILFDAPVLLKAYDDEAAVVDWVWNQQDETYYFTVLAYGRFTEDGDERFSGSFSGNRLYHFQYPNKHNVFSWSLVPKENSTITDQTVNTIYLSEIDNHPELDNETIILLPYILDSRSSEYELLATNTFTNVPANYVYLYFNEDDCLSYISVDREELSSAEFNNGRFQLDMQITGSNINCRLYIDILESQLYETTTNTTGETQPIGNNAIYEGIQIYPNPANTSFTIESLSPELKNIQIFTALGKLMHSERQFAKAIHVDASTWPKGVYIVQADLNGVSSHKLLVKE